MKTGCHRYKFTVAYDGCAYSGWQIQKGSPTIQEELEKILEIIAGVPVRIHGSGRTDAGVHALGQVFHADIPLNINIPDENWPQAMNTRLPAAIRILAAQRVDDAFHARFSAIAKTYRYTIATDRILMPFDFGRVGHYPHQIDSVLFRESIHLFRGSHEFRAFAATRGNEPDPLPEGYFNRTIGRAEVRKITAGYEVEFTGNGFLYKMVRLMVGTALAVASGKEEMTYIKSLLESEGKKKTRFCAVPYGLKLVSVEYPEEFL